MFEVPAEMCLQFLISWTVDKRRAGTGWTLSEPFQTVSKRSLSSLQWSFKLVGHVLLPSLTSTSQLPSCGRDINQFVGRSHRRHAYLWRHQHFLRTRFSTLANDCSLAPLPLWLIFITWYKSPFVLRWKVKVWLYLFLHFSLSLFLSYTLFSASVRFSRGAYSYFATINNCPFFVCRNFCIKG